jgi:hypothetical protein
VEPRTEVPVTETTISIFPAEEGVKVSTKLPPMVLALKVEDPVVVVDPELEEVEPPLKVPPPLDVMITDASVLRPWASVIITVRVVVAPLAIGLLAVVTVTWAAGLFKLPEPVVVPLVMLFLLLVSEELHPRDRRSNILKNEEIKKNEKGNFLIIVLIPVVDIFVFSIPTGFAVSAKTVKIIFPVGSRGLVYIGLTPGVHGEPFL